MGKHCIKIIQSIQNKLGSAYLKCSLCKESLPALLLVLSIHLIILLTSDIYFVSPLELNRSE